MRQGPSPFAIVLPNDNFSDSESLYISQMTNSKSTAYIEAYKLLVLIPPNSKLQCTYTGSFYLQFDSH